MIPDKSQQEAIDAISSSEKKINLLIGRAGYGKSFTVSHIVKVLIEGKEMPPEAIRFCAPTGKAADVLQDELAHLGLPNEAMTIHRMLGCRGIEWDYTKDNRLDASYVFVDESSMIGSSLFQRLLTSVSEEAVFVYIGDASQLAPVSAGCPFKDISSSPMKEIIHELKVCHRQKEGSLIANASESVRNGKAIAWGTPGEYTLGGIRTDDLFIHKVDDEDSETRHIEIMEVVCAQMAQWWKDGEDFVVLAPQHGGGIGVTESNKYIQLKLNGDADGIAFGDSFIGLGDRVRQTKNNYDLNVFNGMVGTVVAVNDGDSMLTVQFGRKKIRYTTMNQIFNLVLGYVVTVHASQGSGYDYGVVIADRSNTFMWSRQLLYVAMTRFKKECHVVGQKTTVARAVRKDLKDARMTYLGGELEVLQGDAKNTQARLNGETK